MKYNWNTTFITDNRQMLHEFDNSVTVLTDFRFGTTAIYRDGEKINHFPTEELAGIEAYTLFLENTARQAEAVETH